MSDALQRTRNEPGYLPDETQALPVFDSKDPVGTWEEVHAAFPILKQGQVVVCGPGSCKAWASCRMVDIKGKAGPHFGAIEYIRPASSPSGNTIHTSAPMPCYAFPFEQRRMRLNGGTARWKAFEGAEVIVPGSTTEPGTMPGTIRHKQIPVKFRIPKFPRPNENPELIKFALIQEALHVDEDIAGAELESGLVRIARGVTRGPMDPAEVARLEQQSQRLDAPVEDEPIRGSSGEGTTLELNTGTAGGTTDDVTKAPDGGGTPDVSKPGRPGRGNSTRG